MFEIGTKFLFGGRLFCISKIDFESKPFPNMGAQFQLYLDEYQSTGSNDDWAYLGTFADITPASLVWGLQSGGVEIVE